MEDIGKLSFNIPGLNTNKKIDISSQPSSSNQQEIKIRNLKLPNNQPLFEDGAAINSLAVTQDENVFGIQKHGQLVGILNSHSMRLSCAISA